MPARNKVPYAGITVSSSEVLTIGSHDHIVIGTDTAPVLKYAGVDNVVTALVAPADLALMERAAREAKKGITCDLTVTPLMIELTPMGNPPVRAVNHAADVANLSHLENLEALREMLDAVEIRTGILPGTIAFSRGYMSKFDKVKTSNKDHALAFAMTDHYYPVLVKCGPTFRGMVAPVDERVYAENVDPDGLW